MDWVRLDQLLLEVTREKQSQAMPRITKRNPPSDCPAQNQQLIERESWSLTDEDDENDKPHTQGTVLRALPII